jgi:hypothetical protein
MSVNSASTFTVTGNRQKEHFWEGLTDPIHRPSRHLRALPPRSLPTGGDCREDPAADADWAREPIGEMRRRRLEAHRFWQSGDAGSRSLEP